MPRDRGEEKPFAPPPVSGLPSPVFHGLADGAALVEYPGLSDDESNARAVAGALAFARDSPEGLFSAVVGARTLFLEFDPYKCPVERIALRLATRESSRVAAPRRILQIPVVYGEEAGSELPELASAAGLAPHEFARLHAAAVYRVAFLGFAPGFAYLAGLPPKLQAPRLSTPRPRIGAGTVAIAGPYTGIYPGGTPGGWRSIGSTHVRLFDAAAEPPTLFLPGDEVRFERVDSERLLPPPEQPVVAHPEGATAAALFRVVGPGVFTSVQGAPRFGWSSYGVPPGGAMDRIALAQANATLGNPADAAALEMTLVGAELEALADTTICLAGSDAEAESNGITVALEETIALRRGDRLRVGRIRGGVRTYLAVVGGFAPAARFEISQRLAAGALLFAPPVPPSPRPALRSSASLRSTSPRVSDKSPSATSETVVRVVLDPREVPFPKEGVATFLSSTYRVSASSDRRGIRLEGQPIALSRSPDIPPEGTPLGGIQIARDGLPIVLGPDRPVTGGYARVATVIQADFPLLAQRPAGGTLRFVAVPLAEALAARVG
jgi:KipI family sensor histidine kinase inhibitor